MRVDLDKLESAVGDALGSYVNKYDFIAIPSYGAKQKLPDGKIEFVFKFSPLTIKSQTKLFVKDVIMLARAEIETKDESFGFADISDTFRAEVMFSFRTYDDDQRENPRERWLELRGKVFEKSKVNSKGKYIDLLKIDLVSLGFAKFMEVGSDPK